MSADVQPKPTSERVPGDVDTPAKIVEESLRVAQVGIDKTDALIDDPERFMPVIGQLVANFGVAFLMEALRRAAPEVAERAARELWSIWDSGDSVGELTWEWRQQIAAGRPIDSGNGGKGYVFHRLLAPVVASPESVEQP